MLKLGLREPCRSSRVSLTFSSQYGTFSVDVASLLLLHAPNPVVQGIVECDLPVVQNGEPLALRKVSIARVVLPTAGAWAAQFSGPLGIACGNKAAARPLRRQWNQDLLRTEQRRKLRAQPAHGRFEAIVEHVATMVIPPLIHWPLPPNSGWLNWANVPPPAATAKRRVLTASTLTP
jgi:hypothetical protein